MIHDVKLEDARRFISNYQKVNKKVEAFMYEKVKIDKILGQEGCTGIRIYFGLKDNGSYYESALVIVGTDSKGKDINADKDTYLAEYGIHNLDIGSPIIS
jgi:hypothetical protein